MPTSTTFWDLIDRWDVSDDQAPELVGYEGKLPTAGTRPRFKLSAEQAGIVSRLLEIDSPRAAAGVNTAWLRRKDRRTERTPLDLMRAGATADVIRSMRQAAYGASQKSVR